MNCTNCKNPIQENASECEWCNFVFNTKLIKSTVNEGTLLNKGECIFFSKRIKKTNCFYEINNNGIKIFDAEEKLNLFIKRDIIYNIEPYSRLMWLHLIPVMGTLIRFIILSFNKYKSGFCVITSKSGKNVIITKKSNYKTFKLIISDYI